MEHKNPKNDSYSTRFLLFKKAFTIGYAYLQNNNEKYSINTFEIDEEYQNSDLEKYFKNNNGDA